MLVLTRRTDDEILIGRNVRIRVVSVNGGAVRIGIDAPRELPITRPDARRQAPRAREAEMQATGARRFVEQEWGC